MAAAGLRSLCDCGNRGRFAHQWLRLAHRESAQGWLTRNCHTSGGGHRRSLWRGLVQGGPRLTTVGRYAARAQLFTVGSTVRRRGPDNNNSTGRLGGRSPPLGPLPRKPQSRIEPHRPGSCSAETLVPVQVPGPMRTRVRTPARSSWRPSHELRDPPSAGGLGSLAPVSFTPRDGRSRDFAGA